MTDSRRSARAPEAPAAAGAHTVASFLAYVVVLAFAIAAVALVISPGDNAAAGSENNRQPALGKLRAATTNATLKRAPTDPEPGRTTDGVVVRPLRMTRLYDEPGGRAFAKVGPDQAEMGQTWLPVVDTRGKNGQWARVLLPSRPNGSTGWLRTAQVEQRSTPYVIRVHLGSRQLELFQDGQLLGSWTVAIGKPTTPTPTGRTFLLGSITDPNQSFSPVILPLGSHSDTLDTYGGGPGTVALHTWPDSSVFGSAASHGCIRVPADALDQLMQVPLGSLVLVDQQ